MILSQFSKLWDLSKAGSFLRSHLVLVADFSILSEASEEVTENPCHRMVLHNLGKVFLSSLPETLNNKGLRLVGSSAVPNPWFSPSNRLHLGLLMFAWWGFEALISLSWKQWKTAIERFSSFQLCWQYSPFLHTVPATSATTWVRP